MACVAIAKWFGISDPKMQEIYNTPEMAKHRPEEFYDDTFMKELDRSGYIDRLYDRRN